MSAQTRKPPPPVTPLATPEILERRLNDGWNRIEEAKRRGDDVTAWEDFWIDLLHQYEAACDLLPEAER